MLMWSNCAGAATKHSVALLFKTVNYMSVEKDKLEGRAAPCTTISIIRQPELSCAIICDVARVKHFYIPWF